MSTQPPEDDPFLKKPQDNTPPSGDPYGSTPPPPPPPPPSGSPYDNAPPPPYDPNAYGGGAGYGATDPLAGMPPLADSGKRVLARIIDIVIISAVIWLILLIFGGFKYDTDHVNYGRQAGQSLLAAVLYIGYDVYMTVKQQGQTVGKRIMKLRVANLNDGSIPTVQTALVRAAVLWLPAVFCCACIWTAICGGWSFFDKPYKQGLHDKAGKTVVVSA
ncbi:RDD family protein [Streptomyces sp. NBC_01465]|uniref:RDD family protein n=1 Tax=Streptomyces sp. NBC_01465 TaxID=2903878 RepID=UPI002E367EF3|nr:RDD family protein [Streptomyces sp. NBC_01465]